jgi:hypothetical protein
MKIFSCIAAMILLVLTVAACGGGGGGGGGTGSPTPPSPTTYTKAVLTLKATQKTTPASAPLEGVKVTVNLPLTVEVAPSKIGITGSSLDNGSVVYDSAAHQLTMQFTGTPIPLGDLAIITATIPVTSTPDKTGYQIFSKELYGFSVITGGPVDLSSEIDVTLSVEFL